MERRRRRRREQVELDEREESESQEVVHRMFIFNFSSNFTITSGEDGHISKSRAEYQPVPPKGKRFQDGRSISSTVIWQSETIS